MPEPDDAPLWAEVLGLVLVGGLVLRAAAHVWAARQTLDVEPEIEDNDVTLQSPVKALRGEPGELVARAMSAAGAMVCLVFIPVPMHPTGVVTAVVAAWTWLQIGVAWADPLAMLAVRFQHSTDTELTDATTTADD